jgi:hypothetical protein
MKLLVDTDAFCKLGVAGLLSDTFAVVGVDHSDCGRLAALPYMLRRGGLRKRYGAAACDELIPTAEAMQVLPTPSAEWIDRFASLTDVDPGEAQLLASAAEHQLLLLSGDKRALRAIGHVDRVAGALNHRVAVLEAVFIALLSRLGVDETRRRATALLSLDKTAAICLSPGNPDPLTAFRSYFDSVAADVQPLVLWTP